MTEWMRARIEMRCGGCGRELAVGDPMLAVRLAGVRRVLVRCQDCAGEAVPDLPALVAQAPPTFTPMVHIMTGASVLPLDFKQRQVGEDD